ncbi:tetratricopeptide repeat protein [Nannocystaceae bacterium ST9]
MSTDANTGAKDQVDSAILAALRQHADAGASDDEDDAALISAVVAAHVEVVQRRRTTKSAVLVMTGLLAAAAAAAWLLLPPATNRDTTRAESGARSQAVWLSEPRGTPLDGVVAPTDGEACGARRDARACLTPGSRAVFGPEGDIELHEGTARVEAQGPIRLFLADVRVQATTDAADFIATLRAHAWEVSVESGMVTVTRPDGASEVVEAGESTGSGPTPVIAIDTTAVDTTDAKPPEPTQPANEDSGKTGKPTASADALLELARSQRAARDFEAAAQTYEQLIRTWPNSTKVRATHVSLAQLYQGPLDDPANALRHFDQYLERGGPLAEEAHYGKIRALRSLGRTEAAKTEVEAFLRTYPDSVHADALAGG